MELEQALRALFGFNAVSLTCAKPKFTVYASAQAFILTTYRESNFFGGQEEQCTGLYAFTTIDELVDNLLQWVFPFEKVQDFLTSTLSFAEFGEFSCTMRKYCSFIRARLDDETEVARIQAAWTKLWEAGSV
jgi:hypothetical protein